MRSSCGTVPGRRRSHSARRAARPSARAADSGYAKLATPSSSSRTPGVPSALDRRRARACPSPPRRRLARSRPPTSSAPATTGGTKRTMTASTPPVGEHERDHLRVGRRGRRAEHVDGFATLASAGSTSRARPASRRPSSGSSRPGRLARVGAEDPEPARVREHRDAAPARERLATRAARPRRSAPRACARGCTPAWWKSASTAASEPASAAVCELAARAPARVVPAFIARIGFRRATRRAIRPNLRGLPNDSR